MTSLRGKSNNDKEGESSSAKLSETEPLNTLVQVPGVAEETVTEPIVDRYISLLKELRDEGKYTRSDRLKPSLLEKPEWFDEELFENAKSIYGRHFMAMNFAHLSGLLLLVRVDSIYRTLSLTGESDTVARLFKRYYNTLKHVKNWYEGDIFEENSDAYRSLLTVKSMHNRVSSNLNDAKVAGKSDHQTDDVEQELGDQDSKSREKVNLVIEQGEQLDVDVSNKLTHISEYDLMITQFAFIGFIVTNPKKFGLMEDFSDHDLKSVLHFWRVIVHYLGASEKYNLGSYEHEDIIGFCSAMLEKEYRDSMVKNPLQQPPGIMSVNIVRSIKFVPMLTVYGIMRHLYEILGHELTELDCKKNWYSNLSYILINLVMTRLLAYKPLRSFNNGLFRLSIFVIARIEHWFSSRLESNYGQNLKP